jgi:phosphatidylserine/phosphatidylglycerophosphate/cardiolipin synthase-like enzyme
VQILLADTSSSADFLWKADKSLVKTITKPYLHAKMLLIDNKILLLSSINLSSNSMDKNREM